tara:strand:- start:131 stop:610 length:480 start_codon:yes stop_codon:yes gene_type:complete
MARNRTKLRPEQKAGEKENLDRHWRGLFLDTLADTSNVSAAARISGANPSRAYKVRREEPEFARQWAEALLEGYEHLEMETLHRLRFGTGPDDPKFDIANALRLLAAHKETVAREKARQSEASEEDVLASLDAKIQALRDHELGRAAAMNGSEGSDESA